MNYFDKSEQKCLKLLNEFNKKHKYFKGISATTRGEQIDAVAQDRQGRKISIEMKKRKGDLKTFQGYGDILIEPSKMAYFTKILESGHTLNEKCLYINFLDDAVVIYDFDKLKNLVFYPNHRQVNYGKKQYEYESRIGLKLDEAIIIT